MCFKYKYKPYNIIDRPNFEQNVLFEKKCLNVDLKISSKISRRENETTINKIEVCISKLHDVCSKIQYNNIINNFPKPYQSSTRVTKLNSRKHALYSRRFETSMLCYDVSNCDCCGKMCINHDDNIFKKTY